MIKKLKKNGKNDEIGSLEETEKKATNLLRYIWNSKINSTFWDWWLFSPKSLLRRTKRTISIIFDFVLSFLLVCPWINFILPKLEVPNLPWDYWVVSIISILFILLSPRFSRFKAGDMIDVELPPPTELTVAPVSFMPIMEKMMGKELR